MKMKKSMVQAAMMMGLSLAARRNNTFGLTNEQLSACPHTSRGKSGKSSVKRTGAAAFKRAAKKRNNIRKHK